jgi:hypothetical protein
VTGLYIGDCLLCDVQTEASRKNDDLNISPFRAKDRKWDISRHVRKMLYLPVYARSTSKTISQRYEIGQHMRHSQRCQRNTQWSKHIQREKQKAVPPFRLHRFFTNVRKAQMWMTEQTHHTCYTLRTLPNLFVSGTSLLWCNHFPKCHF